MFSFCLSTGLYTKEITLKHSGREYNFKTYNYGGVNYIKLSDFLLPSKIESLYNRTLHKLTLSTDKNTFIMSPVSNSVYAGGKVKDLVSPLIVKKGAFYISNPAVSFISPFLSYELKTGVSIDLKANDAKLKHTKTVIFLDPGHGGDGEDGLGAEGLLDGKKIYEKEIVLRFSKLLGAALEKNNYSVQYMRNDNDTKISLADRISRANKSGAKVFVSIHANSSATDKKAKGVDVFYMSEDSGDGYAKSVAEAENKAFVGEKTSNDVDNIINSMLVSSHIKEGAKLAAKLSSNIPKDVMNRGVKKAPFAVLSKITIPSVLIELGFMSNQADLKRITNEEEMKKLAENIAKGIKSYLSKYKT